MRYLWCPNSCLDTFLSLLFCNWTIFANFVQTTNPMAQYDVFISYSRKDMAVANRLCEALDKLGVSYCIDRNLHGAANFLSEITRYIRNCKVVVFIASPNSAQSEWAQKEILFALKHKKEIIPYRIGNFRFEDNDELDFVFTNVQWIESESDVASALKELGCAFGTTPAPTPVPTPAPTPVPTPQPPRKPVNWKKWIKGGTISALAVALMVLFAYALFVPDTTHSDSERTYAPYKVGDYYNDGVKEGVVFDVSADGQHGKIVSMKQSKKALSWASDNAEQKRLIGADSETDGAYNMAKVKAISGWQSKYPAFKWCADLGEGWYLPSKEELRTILRNKDKLNPNLTDKLSIGYWSSTEGDDQYPAGEFCAWGALISGGNTRDSYKNSSLYVYAVSAF